MRSVLTLSLALLLGALAACSGGDASPQTTTPSDGQGGDVPPTYGEPKLLVEGDYLPADFPFEDLAEQGVAAEAADAQKADFEGDVGTVRLYSFGHAASDPSVEKKQCVVERFVEADDLNFAYLPGGTYANGPEFAGVCEGGEVAFIMQQFTTKHGNFQVVFAYGEAAFGHDAPPERIQAEKIGDHEGVVISPLVPEGFGRGWASYATDKGVVIVDGHNLPTDELVKIAGGVECSVC
jgi:hypothetical protein